MVIVGSVKDIDPNNARPRLELSFSVADGDRLPRGARVKITLQMKDACWHGTLCNEGTRRAYLHTRLDDDLATRSSCTDVLQALSLADGAQVEFHILTPGVLAFDCVINAGVARSGRNLRERSTRSTRSGRSGLSDARAPTIRSASAAARPTSGMSFPFDDRAEILRLAATYWSLISARDAVEERAFEAELPHARETRYLSKVLFVRLARWKSVRQTPNYEANTEADIQTATAAAFNAADDDAALTALIGLRGVALRTASAILQWMRPDRFPIIDVRVAALGEPEPTSYDDRGLYRRLADRIRTTAARHSLDLRTLDRALWTWDKLRARR